MPKAHPIKTLPTREYLRACFDYDPETGTLTWKRRPMEHFPNAAQQNAWNGRLAGGSAGHFDKDGYLIVSVNNTNYKAHRLIWKLVTGEEPPPTLDHKNNNPRDNRWSQLRSATLAQQKWNSGIQKNNTSGHRGVFQLPNGTSRAQLNVNKTKYYFGTFNTAEEAAAAYEGAARSKHGEYYRDRRRILK